MTASTAVHSNAFNFMSFIQNGVDPRTGQYTLAINLPALQSHDLAGPELPLTLNYNPLNTQDSGYGLGWDLKLSQYTPGNRILALNTGETFKVTGSGAQPAIKEQKLESFRFFDDGAGYYRVVHKSGLVEFLEEKGGSENRLALPVAIESAQGRRIHLQYAAFASTQLLQSVSDASQTLLAINRSGNQVHIDLHPNAGEQGTPRARYTLQLDTGDMRVVRIILPTQPAASWRLEYQHVRGMLCLSRVHSPTGAVETLEYRDNGHVFPDGAGDLLSRVSDAGLSERMRHSLQRFSGVLDQRRAVLATAREALPRVTRHFTTPGFGQASIDVHYSYELEGRDDGFNFLGRGARGVVWDPSGLDNLYQATDHYRYGSVETLMLDGQALRTIERIFNRYHLLTEEKTTQNLCIKTVSTTYHLVEGLSFDQQPPQCQLPSEVATTWTDRGPNNARTEREFSSFDASGNPTLSIAANGVREESHWYSKDGADGCPPDPFGFVRQLREKIVTPAASAFADAPVLCTRWRYEQQAPVQGANTPWLAATSEVQVELQGDQTETEVQRTLSQYINAPGDLLTHGRVSASQLTLAGLTAETTYSYRQVYPDAALETIETLTTHDGLVKALTHQESVLTGNTLLERDDNDVLIKTAYDALDRVIAETAAPGTPEEATRYYQYRLVNAEGEQAEQNVVDVKGVRTRTLFDGLGRAIYEERQQSDASTRAEQFAQTYAATYDVFGQLIDETEFDWRLGDAPVLPGVAFTAGQFNWMADEALVLKSLFAYDDWGQQCATTGPDGVTEYEQTDPTTLETSAWREGMGKTVTTRNLFDQPERVERKAAAGTPYSTHTYAYDGLGRLRKETDALRRETTYQYDVFDRLTRNVLPDSAVVVREYAPHSAEELPTRISVNQILLGTQTFDGLSRMSQSVTGNRPKSYDYIGSNSQPKFVHTAGGATIEYDYIPHLSDEPVARRVAGRSSGYQLDPLNARLLSGTEAGHTLTREYFSTGELKSEQRSEAGQTLEMRYVYSLGGRLLSYTDVLGNTQTHTYDLAGRLIGTVLASTQATLSYNAQGLNERIDTFDEALGKRITVDLVYDDFGREVLRTFDLGEGLQQQLAQGYNVLDQMETRVLNEGATALRDESFIYDERDRLVIYTADGPEAPVDPAGKQIVEQLFYSDVLDNHEFVMTTFAGDENIAEYSYSSLDPAQLVQISNSHPDYAAFNLELNYDQNGNLQQDEAGRQLQYDELSRLVQVTPADGSAALSYGYDAVDILRSAANERRFYRAGELANLLEGTQGRTIMRAGEVLLAEHVTSTGRAHSAKAAKGRSKAP